MTTFWITGAHGFIGRHLARHLARDGHAVYGIGHGTWPETQASPWGVLGWVNADIDASGLDTLRAMSPQPDQIIHLAGGSSVGSSLANPLEDFSRTVTSTARLLAWMRRNASGAGLVGVSSAAVYGSHAPGQISEDAIPHPYSPYGHHKLMMEQLCRSYAEAFGVRCVIVRLFSVYGPWLRKQLLWDICSRIAGGATSLQLGGTGEELRDWVEIGDVVRMIELASGLESEEMLVLNGGTGVGSPVASVAAEVVRAWNRDIPVTFSGKSRVGDPFSLVARPTTLEQRGFAHETGLHDGVANYVRWFQDSRS